MVMDSMITYVLDKHALDNHGQYDFACPYSTVAITVQCTVYTPCKFMKRLPRTNSPWHVQDKLYNLSWTSMPLPLVIDNTVLTWMVHPLSAYNLSIVLKCTVFGRKGNS